jgi:hypothetical protein
MKRRSSRAHDSAPGPAGGSRRRSASTPPRAVPSITGAVRWSKVLTAQARIAVGYYNRPDVKDLVLDAVLKELKRH